jgi:hypothetical protein
MPAPSAARPRPRLLLPATAERPRNSEASVLELRDGALLMTWSAFRGPGDNDASTVDAMLSHDGGETWGERRTLVENDAGINVMSPALRHLADGSIGLAYSHRDARDDASKRFVRSADGGRTWSEPVTLPQAEPYQTSCHDRMVVLPGGRIVIPLHCSRGFDTHFLVVRTAWSDDGGRTWRLSEPVSLPGAARPGEAPRGGCGEPDIVERADGTLLMVLRTMLGTIFRAESHDGGETWTGLRSMEVVAPFAPSRVARIPGAADLLLLWNWSYDPATGNGTRRPLACAVSTDGGDTWPWARRKALEDDPAATYHYPSCVFVGDRTFVTYQSTPTTPPGAPRGRVRELKTVWLPIPWLYA